ncbi:kinase-like domain [Fusarium agapanthi]|uniref:Kinase-like domain n=1 Tax=Fusarium agapanthi TaxID=1803897 RepID=A0A9P5E9G6_9HYPO|nr:kinase-like domain [Fusarium agapanthi]
MSNPMDPQNPLRNKQCQVQHYKGAPRYWPFERECTNMALLEKIDASLRLARESERDILLNSKPTTLKEAYQNLMSFSTAAFDQTPGAGKLKPFKPKTRINPCHGWTQLSGTTIVAHTQETKAFHNEEQYFAIVYDFVPEGQLEAKNIIDQLNFFHIVGFLNVHLKLENWLSTGVLVDFSDIVPIHTGLEWWRESSMNVGTKAQEQQV